MIDYRLLEALTAVIEEGGFERGAQALHLTQSAVSQRVRQLEERVGQILLVRGQPPQPTTAGQQLLKHFHQVRLLETALPSSLLGVHDGEPLRFPLGINADSLATWFWQAGEEILQQHELLFDLRVDDQDVTLQMLKRGEVAGCISAVKTPLQGCRAVYLGSMTYRLLASEEFIARWFAQGLSIESVQRAPVAIFSRQDALQFRLLRRALSAPLPQLPAHYVPSPEAFVEVICRGLAYGAIPDQQSHDWRTTGKLIELIPGGEEVQLYWHCWNLRSKLMSEIEDCLLRVCRQRLEQQA